MGFLMTLEVVNLDIKIQICLKTFIIISNK
jgi:hypothetical protein